MFEDLINLFYRQSCLVTLSEIGKHRLAD